MTKNVNNRLAQSGVGGEFWLHCHYRLAARAREKTSCILNYCGRSRLEDLFMTKGATINPPRLQNESFLIKKKELLSRGAKHSFWNETSYAQQQTRHNRKKCALGFITWLSSHSKSDWIVNALALLVFNDPTLALWQPWHSYQSATVSVKMLGVEKLLIRDFPLSIQKIEDESLSRSVWLKFNFLVAETH